MLHKLLASLGLHIGTYNYLTTSESHKYIIGIRHNFVIFDLLQIFYQLKISISFIKELGALNCFLLFYHGYISNMPYYLKLFIVDLISLRLNQGCFDQKWSYGSLSNASTQYETLLSRIFYLDAAEESFRKYLYNVTDLLHRLIFFTLYKRLEGVSWLDTFNSVKKFWRFFYYFKYFSFSKSSPEGLIYINTRNLVSPIIEADSKNIPVVLVADNSIKLSSVYLVMGNITSYVSTLFYILLFAHSHNVGKYFSYKKIFTK